MLQHLFTEALVSSADDELILAVNFLLVGVREANPQIA